MATSPHAPSSHHLDASNQAMELIEEVYRTYVHMVLYARKGAGTWGDRNRLTYFAAVMSDPVVICVNDEPYGWTIARATRNLQPGESVEFTDLVTDQVARPSLREHPYVSAELTKDGWRASCDFRRSHPRTTNLLAAGEEFIAAAQSALDQGLLRVFVENAFHAAESFAKAELLSFPFAGEEVENARKHSQLQSAYDLWAMLENTSKRFPALLRELSGLRRAATYADGHLDLREPAAVDLLAVLQELREHAHAVASHKTGRVIKVIATRDIRAGTLVGTSDATMRPRKRRSA